jgi:hypothetical protein
MTELPTLERSQLDAVVGGFSWQDLGRSALGGLLDGGSQGAKTSQGVLQSALRGGIMGLAQGVAGQIGSGNTGGESPEGQQPQPQ